MSIEINGGVYHPLHNKNGWKKVLVSGSSYLWDATQAGTTIAKTSDCFDVTKISTDTTSGRPDNLVLNTDDATEW